jgi:hypothetical protein
MKAMLVGIAAALLLGAASAAVWAQTCRDDISETAPDSRFTDNGDGTVTDKVTELQWKRCSEGQTWDGATCTGSATGYNWQGALQRADGADYAGNGDWRLPNVKELAGIVEQACSDPSIDLAVFPGTPAMRFWSSSPVTLNAGFAWFVSFDYGDDAFTKYEDCDVRLVRGGQ